MRAGSVGSDLKHIRVRLQSAVGVVSQNALSKEFAELYAFLVEAVDVPYEALEHNLVLEVSKELGVSCLPAMMLEGRPPAKDLLGFSSVLPHANAMICAATLAQSFFWLVLP